MVLSHSERTTKEDDASPAFATFLSNAPWFEKPWFEDLKTRRLQNWCDGENIDAFESKCGFKSALNLMWTRTSIILNLESYDAKRVQMRTDLNVDLNLNSKDEI